MTTALNAVSVPLNALRWSSLGTYGDPSCLDVTFLLDAKRQVLRSRKQHARGEDEDATAFGE